MIPSAEQEDDAEDGIQGEQERDKAEEIGDRRSMEDSRAEAEQLIVDVGTTDGQEQKQLLRPGVSVPEDEEAGHLNLPFDRLIDP